LAAAAMPNRYLRSTMSSHGAFDNGPGKHFPPKYVEANYDGYDGYDDVPSQWQHRRHHKFWTQQGGYGDAVMLNPQPLPPKYKFHYVS
jgi:hypothetical protein